MIFLLGFISGVLIILALIVIETYLDVKKKKIIEVIKEIVIDKSREKGIIIPPQDEKYIAKENLLKYNRERGKDTPLSDYEM